MKNLFSLLIIVALFIGCENPIAEKTIVVKEKALLETNSDMYVEGMSTDGEPFIAIITGDIVNTGNTPVTVTPAAKIFTSLDNYTNNICEVDTTGIIGISVYRSYPRGGFINEVKQLEPGIVYGFIITTRKINHFKPYGGLYYRTSFRIE